MPSCKQGHTSLHLVLQEVTILIWRSLVKMLITGSVKRCASSSATYCHLLCQQGDTWFKPRPQPLPLQWPHRLFLIQALQQWIRVVKTTAAANWRRCSNQDQTGRQSAERFEKVKHGAGARVKGHYKTSHGTADESGGQEEFDVIVVFISVS